MFYAAGKRYGRKTTCLQECGFPIYSYWFIKIKSLKLSMFAWRLFFNITGSAKIMRFQTILLAVFIFPLFLAACGGGYTHPYDGTWMAVYPVDVSSSITDTKMVECGTTPGTLVIKDGTGTTTQLTTCTTTYLATSSVPSPPPPFSQIDAYVISVSIDRSDAPSGNDVLNAIVNGVTFIGQCISTFACSATSGENSLSLTR